MTTGQPPGGGVPLGTTIVNGMNFVRSTTGMPATRTKRSSLVSHGIDARQLTKLGGSGKSWNAPSPPIGSAVWKIGTSK